VCVLRAAAPNAEVMIRVVRNGPRREGATGRERREGPIKDVRRCIMELTGGRWRGKKDGAERNTRGAVGARRGYRLNDVTASR
jgi:hypothetical protein